MKNIILRAKQTLFRISEILLIFILVVFLIEGIRSLISSPNANEIWAGVFLITIVIYIFCWERNSILGKLLFWKENKDENKKKLLKPKLLLLQDMIGKNKFNELKEKSGEDILLLFDINFDNVLTEIEKTMPYEQYKKQVDPIDPSLKGVEFHKAEKQRMCEFYIDRNMAN